MQAAPPALAPPLAVPTPGRRPGGSSRPTESEATNTERKAPATAPLLGIPSVARRSQKGKASKSNADANKEGGGASKKDFFDVMSSLGI
ncbi:hypothetical protein STCU_11412 [Strigomonas culicis]|uniref:Uncharacterized protein n=1 Tax=Strigomonas culicis TaxID=28005 RepID=S9THB0_9TRYP|nr:hypothetical protein STCU_11412 [Strigomonas culicis]|eukprot:EPY16309.1 hypothetical protein STCU_11412 [Strigomonas culicis]